MPITTYTGTSELTEVVNQEFIDGFVAGYPYPPPVGPAVAASRPGSGNVPVRFAQLGAIAVPSGTLAQTVDAVDVNIETTESSLTPARVGFTMPVSDDLIAASAVGGLSEQIMFQILGACWNRIDADVHAGSVSASTATGSIATPFTKAALRGAKAAWRAMNVQAGPLGTALVLSGDALTQLEESMEESGATMLLRPSPFFSGHGHQGQLGDLELFSSANVADESTGKSNYITPIGAESGLGIVMSETPAIVAHRGNDGERRATTYFHVRMRYAAGIIGQARFLEVLSS